MRLILEAIVLCNLCCIIGLTDAKASFQYEKMHNYGLGRRIIRNYRLLRSNRNEYPEPLPPTKVPKSALVREPYHRLEQGTRRRTLDFRVFKKSFDYPATSIGHRVSCDSIVNCTITYISVDTDDGIPIILRGGVGYQHFTVVVRAAPGDAINGTISVYCKKTGDAESKI